MSYPIPEDLRGLWKDEDAMICVDSIKNRQRGWYPEKKYPSVHSLIEHIARLEHELADANEEIVRLNEQIGEKK